MTNKIFLSLLGVFSILLLGCNHVTEEVVANDSAAQLDNAEEYIGEAEISTTTGEVTIGEIVASPGLYDGKTVVIEGKFGGWSGISSCSSMPMATRSDTSIYDEIGCIYMSGGGGLDPDDGIGESLKIRATVSLIEGKPILSDVTRL